MYHYRFISQQTVVLKSVYQFVLTLLKTVCFHSSCWVHLRRGKCQSAVIFHDVNCTLPQHTKVYVYQQTTFHRQFSPCHRVLHIGPKPILSPHLLCKISQAIVFPPKQNIQYIIITLHHSTIQSCCKCVMFMHVHVCVVYMQVTKYQLIQYISFGNISKYVAQHCAHCKM